MADLPGAVLFACDRNAVRSAMAEAMLKHLHGTHIYVDSAGVIAGEPDPFAVAVMEEIGLDLSNHRPKSKIRTTRHPSVCKRYWPKRALARGGNAKSSSCWAG